MHLTAIQCKTAQPKDKPYKLTDGQGLYLEVSPNGKKHWRFQYRFGNKRPRLALGPFPEVSLQEARDRREQNRKLLRDGINPTVHYKRAKQEQILRAEHTFEATAREWHKLHSANWSAGYRKDILARLSKSVFPEIGTFPVAELTAQDILAVIRKIEARGAYDIAHRNLQAIGRVMRFGIATGRCTTDPTYRLSEALRPYQSQHLATLDIKELPEFLNKLQRNEARLYPQTIRATKLLMYTFVRTSELIAAPWSELNLDTAEWVIPAARMKMRKDHIVPLSEQVVMLLREQRAAYPNRDYVFPHHSKRFGHMSNCTILSAIKKLGYGGRMTGHGFRALAMTTIKEKLGYRHEVIDRQLAHQPRSKVDRAYDRAQFLDERRVMMQEWADYIDSLMAG